MAELGPFLFYLLLAAALISAELLIFNLSVFWFLFVGIGALAAALLSWLVPGAGWLISSICFVGVSTLSAVALYGPLKRWQQAPSKMPGNDAIGQFVEVLEDLDGEGLGKVLWSGASWDARLVEGSGTLKSGDRAEIVEITGIVLTIKNTA